MNVKLSFIMCAFLLKISCNSRPAFKSDNSCEYYFDNKIKERVYTKADTMASYPNGDMAFLLTFFQNFKYPEQDIFQGRIVFEFIVNDEGVIIQKGIKGKTYNQYTEAEKEALKSVNLLPRWIPAKCGNMTVSSKVYYPIMF